MKIQFNLKIILLFFLLISVCSCKEKRNKKKDKFVEVKMCYIPVDSLKNKAFLDQKFLESIRQIKPNKSKVNDRKGMVLIKSGEFDMGADIPEDLRNMPATALAQPDEYPKHKVYVSDFYMDKHEVTVGQYAEFVKATGYITVAEQDIDWDILKKQVPPNTPKPNDSLLKAGAMLFHYAPESIGKNNLSNWWEYTLGVNWKNPDGRNQKFEKIKNWPVTQISYYDALAYAKWNGARLPTEAEFEYAMRGGLNNKMYPWGNEKTTNNVSFGNFLQGNFPYNNTAKDGFEYIAPVKQFAPNAYGLYDISGNVWEWTNDWYSANYYNTLAKQNKVTINPKGPEKSYEVYNPHALNKSVKGGSFLCNDNWCSGYRNSRRMRLTPDSGMQHLGFRLVKDVTR